MNQDANAHDSEDCGPFCEHPDHYVGDGDVCLDYFLTLVAGRRRDELVPEVARGNFPVVL